MTIEKKRKEYQFEGWAVKMIFFSVKEIAIVVKPRIQFFCEKQTTDNNHFYALPWVAFVGLLHRTK